MRARAGDRLCLQGWASTDGLWKGQRRMRAAVYLLTFWEMRLGKADLGQTLESKRKGLTPHAWMQG